MKATNRDAGGLSTTTGGQRPGYIWRGYMLDEARHFFGKDTVRRTLDHMAAHGLNVFHWHLTDDQGWRLDVPGFPELVKYGAIRPGSPFYGEDHSFDGVSYGPFFYTPDDVREIIGYSNERGIMVVPEIDLPGHVGALLAAHPEFSCLGEAYGRTPYCKFGICDDVVCLGNDEAVAWCERLLEAVMELFPGEYLHIGGDEAPTKRWEKCDKCRARMRELGLAEPRQLQNWFTRRIVGFVSSCGRRAVGWDEIIEGGELPPGTIVQCWRDVKYAIRAAEAGLDVNMSPVFQTYLSIPEGLEDDPYRYRGWVMESNRRITSASLRAFDPRAQIPEELHKRILGAECCSWTEVTKTPAELEYKAFGRLAAFGAAFSNKGHRKTVC
jgi:hexosaminidase